MPLGKYAPPAQFLSYRDSYKFENTTYVTYPKFEREAIADLVDSMWDYKIRLKKQAKRITCSMLLSDSQINRIRACVDGADLRTPVIEIGRAHV